MNEELISEHLRHLRTERGLAGNTVAAYRRDLDRLVAWIGEAELELTDLSRGDLSEFVMTLSHEGLKASSIERIVAGVRGFYKFLLCEGHIARDPTEFLVTPEKGEHIPRFLNREEVVRLIDASDNYRTRAILEVLYATGIRVSELCGLRACDLGERSITVTGKGGKQRIVPISKSAIAAVELHLVSEYGGRWPSDAHIFDLDRHEVWRVVKETAKRAGLDDVGPHTLRHTFATHLMQSGKIDIRFVQQMLGHSRISTTQVYTHITGDKLKENYLRFHPRSRVLRGGLENVDPV